MTRLPQSMSSSYQFSWSPFVSVLRFVTGIDSLLKRQDTGSWLSYYPKRTNATHFSLLRPFSECMRKMLTTPKLSLVGARHFCCKLPGYFLSRLPGMVESLSHKHFSVNRRLRPRLFNKLIRANDVAHGVCI